MMKKTRFILILIFGSFILFSCHKKLSRNELENNLKTAMGLFLNHDPKVDTAKIKFTVLEVSYFEAPKGYICDFKVNMKDQSNGRNIDTTGMMSANISKDFKDVSRRY